jgi:DNA-binding response OmpR family regulator
MTKQQLIAVVDDEPVWLASLGRALTLRGYEPLLLERPERALDEVPRRRPVAMIVDYSMPRLTGAELASRLQGSLGDECPPLILVTGDLEELSPAERAPFAAAFGKPVPLQELFAELRRVVRGALSSGTVQRPERVRAALDAARDDDEPATG